MGASVVSVSAASPSSAAAHSAPNAGLPEPFTSRVRRWGKPPGLARYDAANRATGSGPSGSHARYTTHVSGTELMVNVSEVSRATCPACGAVARLDEDYLPDRLHRCGTCGLLFASEARSQELKKLYDAEYFGNYTGGEDYESDDRQRRYEAELRVRLIQRHGARGNLLELGSASGHFLDEARTAGFAVTGVEPVPSVAGRAAERFSVQVIPRFIEDVDLPAEGFDVVCAWHVLEHVADPRDVLGRVLRALRPGGLLFVEVPNIGSVGARRRKRAWKPLDPEHHMAHYTAAALTAMLEGVGYAMESTETFPLLGYVRPLRLIEPIVAASQVKETLTLQTIPRRPHPWKHDLLRAVARKPDV
jgi:2-polyprenyl-3-methyl-5-hydroxy-6-metoxy-1,4-benzoquinol methylase